MIPRNVKPLFFPLNLIYKGCSIGNYIFLKKSILNDLKDINPKPESVGVLIHEQEHVKRINQFGKWRYAWKYFISPTFRFNEEIASNIPQIRYIKNHKGKFNIEKRARLLSSFPYLWCSSYRSAESKLVEIWKHS